MFAAYVALQRLQRPAVSSRRSRISARLDNTLVIYQNGDNGTSGEGGPLGTFSEVAFFNGVAPPVDVRDEILRCLGHRGDLQPYVSPVGPGTLTPSTGSNRTLRRLGRYQPEHGCDVAKGDQGQRRAARAVRARDRLIRSWKVTGISAPPRRLTASSKNPSRVPASPTPSTRKMQKAPSKHVTQYFEMMGQWAIYHDGWLMSTKANRAPSRPSCRPMRIR